MIISKYPIVDTKEMIFDAGSHSDRFVTKGVLYAKVKVGSSYIHVFNTHLQASYGYEFNFASNPYTDIRHRQIKKLAHFVQSVTSKDHYPIMLTGDFNVNARAAPGDGTDSKEYSEMLELLHHASYKIVDILKEHNDGKHPVTYGGKGVVHGEKPKVGGQRLDFIFQLERKSSAVGCLFSEGKVVPFQVENEVFSHISDHYAQSVLVELCVKDADDEDIVDGANAMDLSHASITLS